MLELQHLKTFMAVVTTMSFSRAADELNYSQSSVTHHIKRLEGELGVRLLDRFRFTKTIALTDAGRKIYQYPRGSWRWQRRPRRLFNQTQTGAVVTGAPRIKKSEPLLTRSKST